ncbi:hypothetical protein NYE69_33435 [Paenibacillus sp. FSL R5-0527]|uniref:hypothetical protein n=1 Tax=Paenibacillus sp. FSL R5-0527 TaxID=2975321 RepID=UPI0026CDF230
MEEQKYKEVLGKVLKLAMDRIETCEPELLPEYVETILILTDRLRELDRQLWA